MGMGRKEGGANRVNPFLPYDEDLWVSHLSRTHTLLLNKFNLTDHHLLVVTREFEEQEVPLTVEDIGATMQVMQVHEALHFKWVLVCCVSKTSSLVYKVVTVSLIQRKLCLGIRHIGKKFFTLISHFEH